MMRHLLLATTALLAAAPALAQETAPDREGVAVPQGEQDLIVTARKRDETLLDVPIAATALTGDTLAQRGIASVREAAAIVPGLNINSDGSGRAFVSIRGVGVTLVQTVQPGVGLFIDGVYQPNTSYLNNPLTDVARIEVLRGPQGTLYGKNTMGGAINVITRVPGNELQVRGGASYAGPDDAWTVYGAAEGAIVPDRVQVRVAASHRQQNGFIRNTVVGGDANPLNTDSVNGTLRLLPADAVTLTVKGYYDWVEGANTPYGRVAGPTDYRATNEFNVLPRVAYRYRGINARLEWGLADGQDLTLVGAYDLRDGRTREADADFGRVDVVRARGNDRLRTKTVEARLNSEWSDQISSLVGLFYSRETLQGLDVTRILPFNLTRTTRDRRSADTYAAFGTLFWKPNTDWEVSLGLRYDHEDRQQGGSIATVVGATALPVATIAPAQIKTDQWQPKLSVTRHVDPNLMAYASVARGYRGGGFNAPTAPTRTYRGDSVWTYEVGGKYVSDDRAVTLSGAVFYNDYKDYIGLNSIAPAAGGGLVTVDLNSGDVESYGIEAETVLRPTAAWTVSGGLTLMRARLLNFDAYTATTGRVLPSDRLTFQPDVTGNLYSDYVVDLGSDRSVTLTGGMTYKGSRLAATLNQATPTVLKGYALVNAAATFRSGPVELGVFANNLFNKRYFESYIEKTTLQLAGLDAPLAAPATDLGIIGDLRRYGVRASFRF